MLYAVTGIPEEIGMLLEAGADSVILHPRDYRADALKQMLEACSHRIILDLPAFATGKETQEILELVKDQQTRISGVRLNNPGQLSLPWPVPCISGPDIPVMNGYTAAYLAEHGVQLIHVSPECNARELKALFAGGGCFAVEAYGRRRLMLLSHCPRETEKGKQSMNPACRGCDASGGWPAVYTDRKGVSFPAMRVKHIDGCHIEILNSTVTDMAKRPEVLRQFQCSLVLVMTDETIEEQCTIVHSYRQLMDDLPISRIPRAEATTGMLFREVE